MLGAFAEAHSSGALLQIGRCPERIVLSSTLKAIPMRLIYWLGVLSTVATLTGCSKGLDLVEVGSELRDVLTHEGLAKVTYRLVDHKRDSVVVAKNIDYTDLTLRAQKGDDQSSKVLIPFSNCREPQILNGVHYVKCSVHAKPGGEFLMFGPERLISEVLKLEKPGATIGKLGGAIDSVPYLYVPGS